MARRAQASDQAVAGSIKQPVRPPVKKGFTISGEAAYRLECAALYSKRDQQSIVDELIMEHLTGYGVFHRPGKVEAGEAEEAA